MRVDVFVNAVEVENVERRTVIGGMSGNGSVGTVGSGNVSGMIMNGSEGAPVDIVRIPGRVRGRYRTTRSDMFVAVHYPTKMVRPRITTDKIRRLQQRERRPRSNRTEVMVKRTLPLPPLTSRRRKNLSRSKS